MDYRELLLEDLEGGKQGKHVKKQGLKRIHCLLMAHKEVAVHA